MLIRRAQGLDRRLAGEDVFLLQPVLLAETFGPELAEPVGQVIQPGAVGHHHGDVLALLIQRVMDRGNHRGRVLH